MQFNTEGFTPWRKQSLKPGELAQYRSWTKDGHRLTLFDSAADLIRHFEHNVKEFGGNGTWPLSYKLQGDGEKEDYWRFGPDYPSYEKTANAMTSGSMAQKYMAMVDKVRDDLFARFPKLHNLSQIAVTKKRRRRFAEDGAELDIDRYMSGDPAMWASMPRQEVRSKIARVYIDLSVSAGTSTEVITMNIIQTLAMADIIEKAGITTEIIVGYTSKHAVSDAQLQSVACIAKGADEPLDVARLLSFALPGMYRQFGFAGWIYTSDGTPNEGLGRINWTFDAYRNFWQFYNATIEVKGADRYWTDGQIQAMINGVLQLFNVDATQL